MRVESCLPGILGRSIAMPRTANLIPAIRVTCSHSEELFLYYHFSSRNRSKAMRRFELWTVFALTVGISKRYKSFEAIHCRDQIRVALYPLISLFFMPQGERNLTPQRVRRLPRNVSGATEQPLLCLLKCFDLHLRAAAHTDGRRRRNFQLAVAANSLDYASCCLTMDWLWHERFDMALALCCFTIAFDENRVK